MCFVDIHTHRLRPDHSVVQMVNLGDDQQWGGLSDLPNVYFSAGYHPWMMGEIAPMVTLAGNLDRVSKLPNVLALGECGLDKLKGPSLVVQSEVFRLHAEISEVMHKPLIIHCVKCFNEIVALRQEWNCVQPWVLHGFTGSPQMVEQGLELGLSFSLGLRNAQAFRKMVQLVPRDRLFFETDESEPEITVVYEEAARVMGCGVSVFKNEIWSNFKRLFLRHEIE